MFKLGNTFSSLLLFTVFYHKFLSKEIEVLTLGLKNLNSAINITDLFINKKCLFRFRSLFINKGKDRQV
jgi:hypothetical protein